MVDQYFWGLVVLAAGVDLIFYMLAWDHIRKERDAPSNDASSGLSISLGEEAGTAIVAPLSVSEILARPKKKVAKKQAAKKIKSHKRRKR
ncbi:Uncharacterised protein [Candidatus Gugararchaeum adminiculabundum]|nr:Uncharacterised protein [Candidatus Gugararchaeum adminiculabundum]